MCYESTNGELRPRNINPAGAVFCVTVLRYNTRVVPVETVRDVPAVLDQTVSDWKVALFVHIQ